LPSSVISTGPPSHIPSVGFVSAKAEPCTDNINSDAAARGYSGKDERHRGSYKVLANHVEAFDEEGKSLGVVLETATPFETPQRVAELVAWVGAEEENGTLHPLLVIAIFVVVFLEIHPFQDGNGHLSRVLNTLLLLRAGYAYVPYSSLESVIEQSKDSYYLALRRTQRTIRSDAPDWNPWQEIFLHAMRRQKDRLEKKMERERVMVAALPELSVLILELAREHGRVTISEVVRVSGVSRNTVKDHLKSLAEQDHLQLHGAGRGAWYGLPLRKASFRGLAALHAASLTRSPERLARSSRFLTDDGAHLVPPRGVRSCNRSNWLAISRNVSPGLDAWMPVTSVIRRSSGSRGGDLRSSAASAIPSETIHLIALRSRSGVQLIPRCFRTRAMSS